MKNTILYISLFIINLLSCKCIGQELQKESKVNDVRTTVEMVTTKGTVLIALYNNTPLHRDNFVKLANEKAYDSLLFHRVIENFMVQGGDPDSRNAKKKDTLGEGDLSYLVKAEINTTNFHKKGALGAAREGNLARASSAMQFYIVKGKVQNDSLLTVAEGRINGWLREHYFKNDPKNKSLVDAMLKAEKDKELDDYKTLNDSIVKLAKSYTDYKEYRIPKAHREVYKKLGGTPHLDQNYTVFGEVIKGLEIIDSIASTPTNNLDRPLEDIRIISVRVLNDE